MNINSNGNITAICGPMRSGKSDELVRIITRYDIAGKSWVIFKPTKDTRDGNKVLSRSGAEISRNVVQVSSLEEIKQNIGPMKFFPQSKSYRNVIGIDEFHFFQDDFTDYFHVLASFGTDIVVSGLDMDHTGRPINTMALVMAIADDVVKLKAICDNTSEFNGVMTIMSEESEDTRKVGGDDLYAPMCRTSWFSKMLQRESFRKRIVQFYD